MRPAQASHTAFRAAWRRAAHQLLDVPRVFDDPLAVSILGADSASALRADPTGEESGPFAPYLRAFLAVRHRLVEDQLAFARAAGVTQYVILGAGLDTFAYRAPAGPGELRVWEVDHPDTQAWKRGRLEEAGIEIPASLTFVPIDFEREALPAALEAAGLVPASGTVFSWLGVTPYLTVPAILETLRYAAAATRVGGGIAFDYAILPSLLTPPQRLVYDVMAARVQAVGEPWQSAFDPAELTERLRGLGFPVVRDISPAVMNARYLADRPDRLQVGGFAHMMWAGTTSCHLTSG